MQHVGYVRFVFEKFDDKSVEVHHTDTFSIGFISDNKFGPMDMVRMCIDDMGSQEQILLAMEKHEPGFYEIVGEAWYEFDPGESTPEYPAEPDAWWEIRNEKTYKLRRTQVEWYCEGASKDMPEDPPEKVAIDDFPVLDKITKLP